MQEEGSTRWLPARTGSASWRGRSSTGRWPAGRRGTRRKRRIQAGIGAGLARAADRRSASVWLLGGFDSEPDDAAAAGPVRVDAAGRRGQHQPQGRRHAARPRACRPTGTRPMTITTDQGAPIVVEPRPGQRRRARAASLAYLAGKSFYDNTDVPRDHRGGRAALRRPERHRAGRADVHVLRRERARPRPSPARRPARRPPAARRRCTRKGTVALIGEPAGHQRQPVPDLLQGLHDRPTPAYSIVGTVTAGLDVARQDRQDRHRGQRRRATRSSRSQGRRSSRALTVGEVGRPRRRRRRPPTPSATASPTPRPASPDAAASQQQQHRRRNDRDVHEGAAARRGAGPAREGDGRARGRRHASAASGRPASARASRCVLVVVGVVLARHRARRRRRRHRQPGAAGQRRPPALCVWTEVPEDAAHRRRPRTSACRRPAPRRTPAPR